MGDPWFYSDGTQRKGPVGLEDLRKLHAEKTLGDDTQVWKDGVASGMPLGVLMSVAPPSGSSQPTTATDETHPTPAERARGFLSTVGSKISSLAGVPEIEDVPVQSVLTSGIRESGPIEDIFAVGTATTTPALASVAAGWPRPRVWWRIFVGAIATYLLLRVGITEFHNARFGPGLVMIGSFVVPLSVVVFFFEMNSPRNVSVYQVCKMVLLGGAVSLVGAMALTSIFRSSGTGQFFPSLLTSALEETAKALALLLIVRETRWSWQLNGLLFGAAVGAGFSGYESAGFAAESSILWRGLLSPGGHVIWTAMIGAALWQVRGTKPFDWNMLLDKIVVRRWIVAVVLHGLWNTDIITGAPILQYLILLLIGWYLVFAVMKGAVAEVATAKTAMAPSA